MFNVKEFLFDQDPIMARMPLEWIEKMYREKYDLAKQTAAKSIMELGSGSGTMAATLMVALQGCHYLGLDNGNEPLNGWQEGWQLSQKYVPEWAKKLGCHAKITNWDIQQQPSLPCGPVDLVYIHGESSFERCYRDLLNAAKIAHTIWVGGISTAPTVGEAVKNFIANDSRVKSFKYEDTVQGDCIIEMNREIRWSHGGDTGDVIAACAAIKALGGGYLHLHSWNGRVREKFTLAKVNNLIKPLLEKQSYIKDILFSEHKDAIDLNLWRHFNINNYTNIAQVVANAMNTTLDYSPWLECDDPNPVAPIVINRTPRIRDWTWDTWNSVLKNYAEHKMVFIGMIDEYEEFCQAVNYGIEYYPTKDLWEVARVLKGCQLFIGSPSLCGWIAMALDVPVLQESDETWPNCIIPRANFTYYWESDRTENGFMNMPIVQ